MTGETHWIYTVGDGHLRYALRSVEGTWSVVPDVPVLRAAEVAGAMDNSGRTHWMFADTDWHLWSTLRDAGGTWGDMDDVTRGIAIPGPVAAVAGAANRLMEWTEWMFTTVGGHLWNTVRRSNGSYSGLGNVNSAIDVPGPVEAVAGATPLGFLGQQQWMFTTADGHLWHTIHYHRTIWTPTGTSEESTWSDDVHAIHIPGPVEAVAGAAGKFAETQWIAITADRRLWHILRGEDGWSGPYDVQHALNIPGPVEAVAGAAGTPGETQWMFTTADGHLWLILRGEDGWSGPYDVQHALNIPGPVEAVAGASGVNRT